MNAINSKYDPTPTIKSIKFKKVESPLPTFHGYGDRPIWEAAVKVEGIFNPSIIHNPNNGSGTTMEVLLIGGDGKDSGMSDWAVYEFDGYVGSYISEGELHRLTQRTGFFNTRREAIEAFLPIHNVERHDKMVAYLEERAARERAERSEQAAAAKRRKVEATAHEMLAVLELLAMGQADNVGSVTFGSYEMGEVRRVIAKARGE